MSKTLEETKYTATPKIPKDQQQIYDWGYKAGRDSMKGKVFSQVKITEEVNIPKEIHNKIREDIKKEILEEVEKITTKNPERESDEYDKGQEDFKNKVKDIIWTY